MTQMTGYDTEDRYYATRYPQGGRDVFAIDLPLDVVAATMPRPDPTKPTPGNRRVKESHARGFAQYVRENEDWVSPALLLRAPEGVLRFERKDAIGGSEFGVLALPRLARTDLRILDGQHRILGICYAVDELAAEVEKCRGLIAAARRQGNADLEHHHQKEFARLEKQRERLRQECISAQIQIEDDPQAFMQMFVDIADNALGITGAIRSRFDSRKVVNRALDDVLKHALLTERVDLEQDRVGGASPYIMGAKHVADIIRTVVVGITGRIGRRQETELDDGGVVEKTNDFLDVLVEGFPQLDAVIEGKLSPEALRKTSLLGSTTFLRVLAGTYHELSKDLADDEIVEFFNRLSRFVEAPIADGSPWAETDVFAPEASAPNARRQDLEKLTAIVVEWARHQPAWLASAA
jgi:hypothetical protein